MRKYDLAFLVMIHARVPLRVVESRLIRAFAEAETDTALDPTGNLVEVRHNEYFDPDLLDDPDEGFLYYAYQLEVYPTPSATIGHQVAFARALEEKLTALGYRAVVCADFEELLETEEP